MYKIVKKKELNSDVKLMVVDAPFVARKAEPGQFVMLRVNETGERIPLTIADYDREKGTITIIFQEVGKTTKLLGALEEGEYILDFAGPLGKASHFGEVKKAAVIGGGLGTAIAYPQAKKLNSLGVSVDTIIGFRNKGLIILEEEMREVSDRLFVTTDDGSYGIGGFVSDAVTSPDCDKTFADILLIRIPGIFAKLIYGICQFLC
jgi:ferredoxin--NADP+ reductase